jgi:hypothetical protein
MPPNTRTVSEYYPAVVYRFNADGSAPWTVRGEPAEISLANDFP